jgi:cytidylate kinase
MPIITISRQYASGGGEVAEKVARRLDSILLDREIIQEVARRLGLPEDVVSERDERGESLISRLVSALRVSYPDASAPADLMDPGADLLDISSRAYVQVTEQVIQETARSGNAVIVGRGSQFILRNHPRSLHVHVYAQFDFRVEAVMKEREIGRQEADRIVRDFDAARGRYARHFYRADWQSSQHYQLMIDAGTLGRELATDLICTAASSL